jgi:hypothetical protein
MNQVDCSRRSGRSIRYYCLGMLWLALAPLLAAANGTPIDRSDINATGNIRMMREANVTLEEETLRVIMNGDWATVRAEYQLANHGAGITVTYGFPIDSVNPAWCTDCDELSEQDKIKAGEPLVDVRIEVDGEPMKTRKLTQPPSNAVEPPPSLRTWVITDLAFDEKQRHTVTVTYRVRNRLDDWYWSTDFDPAFSERKFRYLLSPSGNWGDGKVGKLDISVDISALGRTGAVINTIAPAGYTTDKGVLRWELVNFDLSKAPDLEIVYDDDARLLSQFVSENRLLAPRLARGHATSTLVAPSDPGRHDLAKVLDGDLDTAWCEGASGDGAGQTLTFEFSSASVDAIGIVNGYTKSQDIFQGNGRIKRLTVTVEDRGTTREAIASLSPRDLRRLNRKAIGPFIDWLEDVGRANGPTQRVTLSIADVYSGAKHADTCISEIYFVGYPSE